MDAAITNPVFQAYAASAIVLGFNMLVLANNTALSRAKADEIVNPEDKALNKNGAVVYEGGNDKTSRYRRAHRNALENIPLFLITGYLLTLTGVSFTAAAILFGIFAGARVIHSIAYVAGFQPWRTLSFAVGGIDQAVLLGFLAYYVFFA